MLIFIIVLAGVVVLAVWLNWPSKEEPSSEEWRAEVWFSLLPELQKHGFAEAEMREVMHLAKGLLVDKNIDQSNRRLDKGNVRGLRWQYQYLNMWEVPDEEPSRRRRLIL